MAVWTGNLNDVGLGHLAGLNPEVQFHLNAPQIGGDGKVYATKPAKTTVASTGDFSVNLMDTSAMVGDAWLEMHVVWNEPAAGGASGYSPVDVHVKTPLRTNSSGGPISSAIGGAKNITLVQLSLSAPLIPFPGLMWWKTDPTDPTNVRKKNTGEIRRWDDF